MGTGGYTRSSETTQNTITRFSLRRVVDNSRDVYDLKTRQPRNFRNLKKNLIACANVGLPTKLLRLITEHSTIANPASS